MENPEENKNGISELEERIDTKFKTLFKYKTAQISLKIVVFTTMACLLFIRSGKLHDFYLWFIGLFMLILAVSELIELEEAKQYYKENSKKD